MHSKQKCSTVTKRVCGRWSSAQAGSRGGRALGTSEEFYKRKAELQSHE